MNIEAILDHQTIFENRRSQIFFAVRLQAPHLPCPAVPPTAYCIALDQSASVNDHAFALTQRLVRQLIRHMPDNALVLIIAFHETAEAIIDLGPLSDRAALQAIVNAIEPVDFGTNLSAALLLAREQLQHAPTETMRKKLLLMTDGEHTTGIRDENLLAQIAADCHAQGIQITALCPRSSNADLLDRISSKGHQVLAYESVGANSVTPKVFSTTIRIPALSNTTYPTSEDGSLSLRDGF